MRSRLAVFLILGASAVFGLIFVRQLILSRSLPHEAFAEKKVRLLTYSTFVANQGPGPALIQEFEQECKCKVDVTSVRDAGLLLERLKMGRFDVVVGLDQLMLEDARQNFAWRELSTEGTEWQDTVLGVADTEFVPFDWSPVTFVYKSDNKPVPQKFDELLQSEYKNQMALPDPKASSTGLQFVKWVEALKGDKAEDFLAAFKPNVHIVAPSWSYAYGLFVRGEVRFVLSYLTSLAYHWGVDNDRSYKVLSFPEGHVVQVELAAVPAACKECELGAEFVQHLLQSESQKVIMEKNFMFPALKNIERDSIFAELPSLKIIKSGGGKDLRVWDKVFTQ